MQRESKRSLSDINEVRKESNHEREGEGEREKDEGRSGYYYTNYVT